MQNLPDYGYLQFSDPDGMTRHKLILVKNEYADRWLAWFEGKWRRVHIQVHRLFIVCNTNRITIRIEGV